MNQLKQMSYSVKEMRASKSRVNSPNLVTSSKLTAPIEKRFNLDDFINFELEKEAEQVAKSGKESPKSPVKLAIHSMKPQDSTKIITSPNTMPSMSALSGQSLPIPLTRPDQNRNKAIRSKPAANRYDPYSETIKKGKKSPVVNSDDSNNTVLNNTLPFDPMMAQLYGSLLLPAQNNCVPTTNRASKQKSAAPRKRNKKSGTMNINTMFVLIRI